MGEPLFEPRVIPFTPREPIERVRDYPVPVGEVMVSINALFVGNPQCVVFSDPLPEDEAFHRVGKALQTHPLFPEGTNVSFVSVEGPHEIRIRIYERGVGPTLSSGTGSCGAAVASLVAEKVTSPVRVRTETGVQEVAWTPGSEIVLTGWSELIAKVEFCWRANV
jgi:diaminopimelate epimerase